MDAKLIYKEIAPGFGFFDLNLVNGSLDEDHSLETAVILSLFTDRRADADDILPEGGGDRRGVWSDTFATIDGDLQGSKLWLLSREKQLPDVANRARQYAEEALVWLIEDGIAAEINVTAESVAQSVLGLGVEIVKPEGDSIGFKFNNLWEALNAL